MTTRTVAVFVLTASLAVAACSGVGDQSALNTSERDWCSFSAATEGDALRFDLIFEAGLGLGLDMDRVNRLAGDLRAQYEAEGLSPDAAVAAVSEDLLQDPDFIAACRAAYVTDHRTE